MSDVADSAPRVWWSDRVRASLSGIAPAGTWRIVGAFGATMLTVLATVGGLFFYASEYQAGFVAGACASLIAPSRRSSAAIAAAATFLGCALGPANVWVPAAAPAARLVTAAAAGLLAAGAALACKWLVRRAPGADRLVVLAVVGLLVANVWVTTIHEAQVTETDSRGGTYASLYKLLSGQAHVLEVGDMGDLYAYLQVVEAMDGGEPFYRAWHDQLGPERIWGASAGSSVFNYHLPTVFWFWAALPGSRVSIVYAYLVLVSLAVAAVPFVVGGTVRAPLAIPGAAAVASYLFVFGCGLKVLYAEPWAGALGVLAVAAWTRSSASKRWRAWTVAAVALGVLAALVREPAVLIPIAGLAAALFVSDGQRRFRSSAWVVGLVAFAGAYYAHYLTVRPQFSGPPTGVRIVVSGVQSIASALTFGTSALGPSGALPLMLAAAGILGILQMRGRRTMIFAGVAAASSLLAYMVLSNSAWNTATGAAENYWGMAIVPVVYACVPAAFALVPTMAPDVRRGEATP